MSRLGFDNVLALRGDPPAGQEEWTKTDGGLEYSAELVELIRGDYEFAIGAAAFPETHIHATSAEDDLRHLKAKVDAGVDFLITQLFFDNAAYFDFVARARALGIDAPIIPGILPITNVAQLDRITSLCGAVIPDGLRRDLDARADDAEAVAELGVAYATLQCAELLAGGAPGIHFYTLNRSPGDARDPQRAEAAAPLGVAARRRARRPAGVVLDRADDLEPLRRRPASRRRCVQRTSTESSWR